MAKVSWDDDSVGNKSKPHKFRLGWSRFCLMDSEAEYDKTHYEYGHKICTKKGSKKEFRCGACGNALQANPDINVPGHACVGCGKINGPKVAVCRWCDDLQKEPQDHFATNILHYLTDDAGNPLGPLTDKSFKITWWEFGPDKWTIIRMAKKTYGDLRAHDMMFHCQEEKYQKGSMSAAPDAWWLQDAAFKEVVVAAYKRDSLPPDELSKKLCQFIPYDKQLELINKSAQQNNQQGQRGQRPQPGQQGQMPSFNPQAVQQRVGQNAPTQFAMPSFAPIVPQQQPQQAVPSSLDALFPTSAPVNTPPVSSVDTSDLDKMLSDITK